jgi:hypothetical protein
MCPTHSKRTTLTGLQAKEVVPVPPSFQFVVETGTGKPEGFNRTLVRAHVKRRKPRFEQPSQHKVILTHRQAHAAEYGQHFSLDEPLPRSKAARKNTYKWTSQSPDPHLANSLNPNTIELNTLLSNTNNKSEKGLIHHCNSLHSGDYSN